MPRASRRRALPEPFERAAARIESAQRALLAAVPRPRDDGVPLGIAIAGFTRDLRLALAELTSWEDDLAGELRASVEAAIEAAERLRLTAGKPSFSELNEAIADLMAPLEEVSDLERELRSR